MTGDFFKRVLEDMEAEIQKMMRERGVDRQRAISLLQTGNCRRKPNPSTSLPARKTRIQQPPDLNNR